MPPLFLHPRYRLMVRYDIRPETSDLYYKYVLGDMIPALQNMGLYMLGAWHITYGDYPMRQVEFITEDLETIQTIFRSDRWKEMERKLQSYTINYQRKLVRYRDGFQI